MMNDKHIQITRINNYILLLHDGYRCFFFVFCVFSNDEIIKLKKKSEIMNCYLVTRSHSLKLINNNSTYFSHYTL